MTYYLHKAANTIEPAIRFDGRNIDDVIAFVRSSSVSSADVAVMSMSTVLNPTLKIMQSWAVMPQVMNPLSSIPQIIELRLESGSWLTVHRHENESIPPYFCVYSPRLFEDSFTLVAGSTTQTDGRVWLTEHHSNPLNDALQIEVVDTPGKGGANQRYDVTGFDTDTNPSSTPPDGYKSSFGRLIIIFQNGPTTDGVFNGVSNEALTAILVHRMMGFQHPRNPDGSFNFNEHGPFSCTQNEQILGHLKMALMHMKDRSTARIARGVEGTHTP